MEDCSPFGRLGRWAPLFSRLLVCGWVGGGGACCVGFTFFTHLRHRSLIWRWCNFSFSKHKRHIIHTFNLTECLYAFNSGWRLLCLLLGCKPFGHMGHDTCFLGSNESGRWMLLNKYNLGWRWVLLFLGSLLYLSSGVFCVHFFFFIHLLPDYIQLIVPSSVESKLLLKFTKYGVIHLGNLLEGSVINKSHLRDVSLG